MDDAGQVVMRFADRELLASLVALLPPFVVTVQVSGVTCLFARYMAEALIERALCQGYMIDRTNGDGPLAEWDGWLRIDTPTTPTLLEIAKPGGEKLT